MECFIIVTIGWIFSVCLHEFGHAWVAFKGGDHTVAEKGYLTMNPFKYAHPVYSFLFPIVFLLLGGIGLPGGAVYINTHLLRSRRWEAAASLAGPAMTLLIALLIGMLFLTGVIRPAPDNTLAYALAFLLQLEISALILNLLPIPPLDGFQALAPWLPKTVREHLLSMSNYGLLILFILLWHVEPFNKALWQAVYSISEWFGADRRLGWLGWKAFRFWDQ